MYFKVRFQPHSEFLGHLVMVQIGFIPIFCIMQMCLAEIGVYLFPSQTIFLKVVYRPSHSVRGGNELSCPRRSRTQRSPRGWLSMCLCHCLAESSSSGLVFFWGPFWSSLLEASCCIMQGLEGRAVKGPIGISRVGSVFCGPETNI